MKTYIKGEKSSYLVLQEKDGIALGVCVAMALIPAQNVLGCQVRLRAAPIAGGEVGWKTIKAAYPNIKFEKASSARASLSLLAVRKYTGSPWDSCPELAKDPQLASALVVALGKLTGGSLETPEEELKDIIFEAMTDSWTVLYQEAHQITPQEVEAQTGGLLDGVLKNFKPTKEG